MDLPDCPFLPEPTRELSAASLRQVGDDRGGRFYRLALECAQSLWRRGLPAQALLLINRAFAADLRGDERALTEWPLPYRAVGWILAARRESQFIGNPRRHYQHLATRMVAPRRELRTWRAWACWHLARLGRPDDPADDKQIAREGIIEPTPEIIAERLGNLGLPGEVDWWRLAWSPGTAGPAQLEFPREKF